MARTINYDPSSIGYRQINLWVKLLAALRSAVESYGGILHVEAVFPNRKIEIFPPPALEMDSIKPPEQFPMPEEEPDVVPPVPPAVPEPEPRILPAEEPEPQPQAARPYSNSEILKMWREFSART